MNQSELKIETKVWVDSFTDWMKSLISEGKTIIVQVSGISRWVRGEENRMIQDNIAYYYDHFIYEDIKKLPAYEKFRTALKSNKIINAQLDKLVFTGNSGATLDFLNLAVRLAPSPSFF